MDMEYGITKKNKIMEYIKYYQFIRHKFRK